MNKYNKRYLIFKFLFLNFIITSSCYADSTWFFTAQDAKVLHAAPANARLFYGKLPMQFADLRLPKGPGPHPVVVIIHGGCWISTVADLQNTQALADAIRDLGIATWNVEYRSVDNGGGWPGTFEDLSNSTSLLQKIAYKYSLDLKRVIVIGHSAGGQLALWLASLNKVSPNNLLYKKDFLKFKGAVILGGVTDLKILQDKKAETICGKGILNKILGSGKGAQKRLELLSPMELLPIGIPQILIYGENDGIVPPILGELYTKSAELSGDKNVKYIKVQGAAHQEYVVPNSIVWPFLRDEIVSLIK